jgi:hypothetical protein
MWPKQKHKRHFANRTRLRARLWVCFVCGLGREVAVVLECVVCGEVPDALFAIRFRLKAMVVVVATVAILAAEAAEAQKY